MKPLVIDMNPKRYLAIDSAAAYMGLTVAGLRTRVQMRTIPYIKYGRRILFDVKELDSILSRGRVKTNRQVKAELNGKEEAGEATKSLPEGRGVAVAEDSDAA